MTGNRSLISLFVIVVMAALLAGCSGSVSRRQKPDETAHANALDISEPISEQHIYTVRQGDTLYSIAAGFYDKPDRWRLLYYANAGILDTPEDLAPGMKIYIPDKETSLTYAYTVEEGDTLSKLALKFYSDRSKATIIADYNYLKDPDYITPGQKITIPLLR